LRASNCSHYAYTSVHPQTSGANSTPREVSVRKEGIFRPGKEIEGLRGGVHGYRPARAEKDPFQTETTLTISTLTASAAAYLQAPSLLQPWIRIGNSSEMTIMMGLIGISHITELLHAPPPQAKCIRSEAQSSPIR